MKPKRHVALRHFWPCCILSKTASRCIVAEQLSLLSVHCPEMKKTGRLPPPLNTPEPLPHALTWPATWPPPFYGTTRWTRAEVAGLKGPRSQTSAHADCSLRRYLFCTGKKSAIVCTRTHRGAERTGWGWRGVLRVEAVPPDSQSDAGPRMSLCPRSHSCRWWGFTAFFFFKTNIVFGFHPKWTIGKKLCLLKESLFYSIKATVNNLIMT